MSRFSDIKTPSRVHEFYYDKRCRFCNGVLDVDENGFSSDNDSFSGASCEGESHLYYSHVIWSDSTKIDIEEEGIDFSLNGNVYRIVYFGGGGGINISDDNGENLIRVANTTFDGIIGAEAYVKRIENIRLLK